MIYAFLIRRYLIPYILYSLGALFCWFAVIWLADGIYPTLMFIAFLATLVLALPTMAYLDYREVKQHVRNIKDISKGGGDTTEYAETAVTMISEKTKIPEFIVGFFFGKAELALKRVRNKTV